MNKQILNVALAVVLSGSALSAHAASYTFTDLGTLGGYANSYATAINNAGQVAGSSWTDNNDDVYRATLWNGTTPTDLGTLGGTRRSSMANAINDAGQVAGWSGTANGSTHATVWNGTTATDLGTLGGYSSEAFAINNAGQVVGWSYTADDPRHPSSSHATLWNGTTATDLNSVLDASTVSAGWVLDRATGINDNGWIVGNASNSLLGIQSHAFLLTPVPEAETWAMMLAGLGLVGWTTVRRRRAALPI